jgi:hypothetical protein
VPTAATETNAKAKPMVQMSRCLLMSFLLCDVLTAGYQAGSSKPWRKVIEISSDSHFEVKTWYNGCDLAY